MMPSSQKVKLVVAYLTALLDCVRYPFLGGLVESIVRLSKEAVSAVAFTLAVGEILTESKSSWSSGLEAVLSVVELDLRLTK